MATAAVAFRVIGDPATKGSTRAFIRGRHAVVTNDCTREKPWAQAVWWFALEVAPASPWTGPVRVEVEFILPRPGRLGKRRFAVVHAHRPDLDKLTRSVLDALTGLLWQDDGQVAALDVRKRYADPGEAPGARVIAAPMEVAA